MECNSILIQDGRWPSQSILLPDAGSKMARWFWRIILTYAALAMYIGSSRGLLYKYEINFNQIENTYKVIINVRCTNCYICRVSVIPLFHISRRMEIYEIWKYWKYANMRFVEVLNSKIIYVSRQKCMYAYMFVGKHECMSHSLHVCIRHAGVSM